MGFIYIYSQFRFATIWEKYLSLLGVGFVSIAALGIPFNVIIYGEFSTLLVDRSDANIGSELPSTSTIIISLFGGGKIL